MIDLAREPVRPRDLRAAELTGGDVSDLVAQLPWIPAALRHPAILAAVRAAPISEDAWRSAARSLAELSPQRRNALRRLASVVKTHADLLDFLMRIRHAPLLASPFPAGPDLGPSFRPLADLDTLRVSGSAMRNCLATYATDAATGLVFFYLYEDAGLPHVVVGLEPGADDGWAVWVVAAHANRTLPRKLHDTIVAAATEALGPELREPGRFNAAMRRVAAVGRTRFPEAERHRLFAEMVRFFNLHAGGIRGAVCSYRSGESMARRWVQLVSLDASQSYVCEIPSHRYPSVNPHWLTEASVALLDACRFRWPHKVSNFTRELRICTVSGLWDTVDFLLGLHCELWHHDPTEPIAYLSFPPNPSTECHGQIGAVLAQEGG